VCTLRQLAGSYPAALEWREREVTFHVENSIACLHGEIQASCLGDVSFATDLRVVAAITEQGVDVDQDALWWVDRKTPSTLQTVWS